MLPVIAGAYLGPYGPKGFMMGGARRTMMIGLGHWRVMKFMIHEFA